MFGLVCDVLNIRGDKCYMPLPSFLLSCHMPRRKTGTSESSDHVCRALSSVRDQLLSWPLHPGYWMSRGTNRCPLWQLLERRTPLAGGVWRHPLGARVGPLSPALHPGYWMSRVGSVCCTTVAYAIVYASLVVDQGTKGTGRCVHGVWHGIHLWASPGGMGHAPTKACLG